MTRRRVIRAAATVVASLLLTAAPVWAAPFVLHHALANPAPKVGDFFGAAVAVAGGRIVVGAHFDDLSAADAGTAYLYDQGSGALLVVLPNPTPAAGDQFGFAVAALGNDVFVSAPHHDGGAPRSGVVHVFDAASGALRRTIANPTPAFDELFGLAVAAAGNVLVVGAPLDGTGLPGAGAVYVFDRGGGLGHTLLNPTPGEYDLFGRAVATDGAVVVVGVPLADLPAPPPDVPPPPGTPPAPGEANAGLVHVFDAGTGALRYTLMSPQAAAGNLFGAAVAAGSGLVLVGVPFDNTTGSNSGAVYLFDAATGVLRRIFVSPEPLADARFGAALAITGGTIVVAAPFDDAGATDVGRVYLFDAASGAHLATLENPDPRVGDQFGAAVAAAGMTVVAGTWLDDTGSRDAGMVYQFVDLAQPVTSTTTSTATTFTFVTFPTIVPPSSTTSTATSTTTSLPGSGTSTTSMTTPATATSTTSIAPPLPTSTTTVAATSTTTTAPGVTATTTTTATTAPPGTTVPSCATGCDDGDPCTVDTCTPGDECRHAVPEGFDGVTCGLDRIDAALHAAEPFTFGGARMAARLQRRIARARRLVDAARDGVRPERSLRRAERSLGRFVKLVEGGLRRGRIARVTAEQLLARADEVTARLAPLRTLYAAGR